MGGSLPPAEMTGFHSDESQLWGDWTSSNASGTWSIQVVGPLKPRDAKIWGLAAAVTESAPRMTIDDGDVADS